MDAYIKIKISDIDDLDIFQNSTVIEMEEHVEDYLKGLNSDLGCEEILIEIK